MGVQNKKRVLGTATQKKLAAPAPFAPLVILITPSQYIRSVFIITLDAHKRRKNTRSLATLTNNAGARSRTPSLPTTHPLSALGRRGIGVLEKRVTKTKPRPEFTTGAKYIQNTTGMAVLMKKMCF